MSDPCGTTCRPHFTSLWRMAGAPSRGANSTGRSGQISRAGVRGNNLPLRLAFEVEDTEDGVPLDQRHVDPASMQTGNVEGG